MQDINDTEGTFMIDCIGSTKECDISEKIPIQTMYLRSYRVQFNSAIDALANGVIYVDMPCFSSKQMLDTNPDHTNLPILVDNAIVTHAFGKHVPIYMSKVLDQKFKIRFLDASFNVLPATFIRGTLVFSTTKSVG